jgi:hypothetical protein
MPNDDMQSATEERLAQECEHGMELKHCVRCMRTEIKSLRAGLTMICEETLCPELFPKERDEVGLQLKTAVVIARATLDPKGST